MTSPERLSDADPHFAIPTPDGNVHVVSAATLRGIANGTMPITALEDWHVIIQQIVREWMNQWPEPTPDALTRDVEDLGHGITMRWYQCIPHGEHAGIIIDYGDDCSARIPFCGCANESAWKLVTIDPLTIEPSIRTWKGSGSHEHHGFIREGKWVPA